MNEREYQARIAELEATIGDFAFYGCSSLASVNIPDGVTTIAKFLEVIRC